MDAPIAIAMIVLYLGVTTLVGVLLVRRSRGSDDWSVAGGRMGVLMIGQHPAAAAPQHPGA